MTAKDTTILWDKGSSKLTLPLDKSNVATIHSAGGYKIFLDFLAAVDIRYCQRRSPHTSGHTPWGSECKAHGVPKNAVKASMIPNRYLFQNKSHTELPTMDNIRMPELCTGIGSPRQKYVPHMGVAIPVWHLFGTLTASYKECRNNHGQE